nr:E6 protein [Rodent papillomavirus]
MELIEGFTLLQLLRFLNVSLETIILPCNFCFTVLGILDKASFAASKLKVVVRDKCYKGACISCRRALAAAEKKKYLVCWERGTSWKLCVVLGLCIVQLDVYSAWLCFLRQRNLLPRLILEHFTLCAICGELSVGTARLQDVRYRGYST